MLRPRWMSSTRRGVRCGCASRGRSAGSRSRTSPAIATRSAPARRRVLPRHGLPPRMRRSTRCSCAGRAATPHSPPRRPRPAGGSPAARSRNGCARWPPPGRCSKARSDPGGASHEFTDPDVLRQLRRRSLARLRREVEPVDPEVFARFLPAWQGVAATAGGPRSPRRGRRAARGGADAGLRPRARRPARPRCGLHASPPRRAGSRRRGGLDRTRIPRARRRQDRALPPRSRRACSPVPGPRTTGPSEPIHEAIRAHLQRRGASFFPQLRATVGEARNDDELLDAMWDLVWSGEVTNDTFAALSALSLPRSRSKSTPRPGRLIALGPPRAAGRWSLVADLVGEGRSPTERGRAAGDQPPRAPRHRHPRGGGGGVHQRRLRIGVSGPSSDGGGRACATRVLRGRARGGAVRAARRCRSAQGRA